MTNRSRSMGGGNGAALRTIVIWLVAGIFAVVGGLGLITTLRNLGIAIDTTQSLQLLAVMGLFATVAATVATYVLIRQDSVALNAERAQLWRYAILGLLPVAVLALGAAVFSLMPAGEFAAGIAVLLSAGMIGLLLSLAITAVFFNALSINDKNEALGLPRGSIRAVIALALILVFAIMAVYLYSRTTGPAAEDIAKQLVTKLSVLVVAVSSFYFGSKSVEAAAKAVGGPGAGGSIDVTPPQATIIGTPPDVPWDPPEAAFQVHAYPANAKITTEVWGDDPSSVAVRGGLWVYTPKKPANRVGIRFSQVLDPTINAVANIDVKGPDAADDADAADADLNLAVDGIPAAGAEGEATPGMRPM